jgi:glyoxylate/hydroxypyruvate reductase A
MIRILFSAPKTDWDDYRDILADALQAVGVKADVEHTLTPSSPETIDYIVYAPSSKMRDFSPFSSVKLVQNLWAGVEDVATNDTLTHPLARMVDSGLTDGMVEWCVGHVMRHHLGLDRDINRTDRVWAPVIPPLATDQTVVVLGLGALGAAVANALSSLKFHVRGWSRSEKHIAGVECHSGENGLTQALHGADIVVLLLPQTPATGNILNANRIALLADGAVLINPGRGPLIDDRAVLAALDSEKLSHATLDVFRVEPLPQNDPYWTHPKVTVTPHVASATRPASAARVIAENIRRGEAGQPFLHLVDRAQGY